MQIAVEVLSLQSLIDEGLQQAAQEAAADGYRPRSDQHKAYHKLEKGTYIQSARPQTKAVYYEAKLKAVLSKIVGDTAEDFIFAFGNDSSIFAAVMQELGYMRVGRSHHGALTDGHRYWSLFTLDGKTVAVTDAYFCSQPGTADRLSVTELHMYVFLKELTMEPLPMLSIRPFKAVKPAPPPTNRVLRPRKDKDDEGDHHQQGASGSSAGGGGQVTEQAGSNSGSQRQQRPKRQRTHNQLSSAEQTNSLDAAGPSTDAAAHGAAHGGARSSAHNAQAGATRSIGSSLAGGATTQAAEQSQGAHGPSTSHSRRCVPFTPTDMGLLSSACSQVGQEFTSSHAVQGSLVLRLLPHVNLELLQVLGQGQTGIVYKAKVDGKLCAFKHVDIYNSLIELERLQQEDSMYEHIVATKPSLLGSVLPRKIDSGFSHYGCARFLAVEYVEGVTAAEVKQWDASEAQLYCSKALQALDQLHGAGMAHGDLSPDNILIDRQAQKMVLIDLGNAHLKPTQRLKAQERSCLSKVFASSADGSTSTNFSGSPIKSSMTSYGHAQVPVITYPE